MSRATRKPETCSVEFRAYTRNKKKALELLPKIELALRGVAHEDFITDVQVVDYEGDYTVIFKHKSTEVIELFFELKLIPLIRSLEPATPFQMEVKRGGILKVELY